MKNLVLIFSIFLFAITFNMNGQTRNTNSSNNGQWKQIYDGNDRHCKYFKSTTFEFGPCPFCGQSNLYEDKIEEMPRSNVVGGGNKWTYTCKDCNSVFEVKHFIRSQESVFSENYNWLNIRGKKGGADLPQKREHKIDDMCVEGICFALGNDVQPNMPTQHFAITRDRRHEKCPYYIEFTLTEIGTDNITTVKLAPNSGPYYKDATAGKQIVVSNVRHIADPNVNQKRQNNTQPTKRNNTRQKSRRK